MFGKMKRQMAAWILLAVFLPMLILSALHIHQAPSAEEDSCTACTKHHCHGHLAPQTASFHQCVLCQFLSLTFVTAAISVVVCFHPKSKINFAQYCQATRLTYCGLISLRAPPAV